MERCTRLLSMATLNSAMQVRDTGFTMAWVKTILFALSSSGPSLFHLHIILNAITVLLPLRYPRVSHAPSHLSSFPKGLWVCCLLISLFSSSKPYFSSISHIMSFPYGHPPADSYFKKNQSIVAQKAEQESKKYLTLLTASHTCTHLRTPAPCHLPSEHLPHKTAESQRGGHLPSASDALISELLGGSIHFSVCGLNVVSLAVA